MEVRFPTVAHALPPFLYRLPSPISRLPSLRHSVKRRERERRRRRRRKRIMEKAAKVICSVVGFFGLLSVALGLAADATRIKASQIQFTSSSTCTYPSSPAWGLGLAAAVSLAVAQIVFSIATGWFCYTLGSYTSYPDRIWAVISFFSSWLAFVAAFRKLLSGAAPHGHHGNEKMYFGNHSCYFVKSGVFAEAASWSLIAVVCGITCYLGLDSVKIRNKVGSAMVHPQCPPPQSPPPNKTVELKLDWPKGYSRLSAAHVGLRSYDDAVSAYKIGLDLDPTNEALHSGLKNARSAALKS
ncbi:hypothetical protein RHMOL_Rhmol03G0242300 [Rhododendron molle]|uniref:Uncharacterized protein n=1 Tax=Rhododendron molle TaxID=49168 RepID=A0ACC0PHM5_RHOML|nr:hypothetical protein RHMOL_Rhmol03G0242300 [Rhododendron molle]